MQGSWLLLTFLLQVSHSQLEGTKERNQLSLVLANNYCSASEFKV